jgi:hypothetical protein
MEEPEVSGEFEEEEASLEDELSPNISEQCKSPVQEFSEGR